MKRKDIEILRGETFSFAFKVSEEIENAQFTAKRTTNKDDTDYVFEKEIGDGITLTGEEGGKKIYTVRLAPEDTNDLDAGIYYYDFRIIKDNDIFKLLVGKLEILSDVKREGIEWM